MSKIFVQENFFDDKAYQEIVHEMISLDYSPAAKESRESFKACYWHYRELPEKCDVKTEIKKLVKKHFNYEIKKFVLPSIYTMVGATDSPKIHKDTNIEGSVPKYQLIIYMCGPESINNGTGFFEEKEESSSQVSFHPTTHVGFKANRAIFFSADIFHSPLQWSGNGSFRYSINNFFT
mgnify:CR=1 FL=1|tara:strand:+ start:576 stop:1109 length:534 start_codon:yes stop_codon:yes gene_type:complete